MIRIISNIFINKTYLSALIITIFLLCSIVIFKNTLFIPMFKQDLINNTVKEATKISKHLTRMINFNNHNNKNTDAEIKVIIEEFDIDKLHYYSKHGEIQYSTDTTKVGNIITDDYFSNIISKGNVYSNVKNVESNITLVEIYIPIMNNGTFTGAFEFYYDVTETITTFNNHVDKVNSYMFIFNLLFLTIISFLLYFASKNNLRDVQYQKELANFKNIMDETNAYIFMKDKSGCYTFANKLVLELFNISLENLIGKDDSSFFNLEISNELKNNDNYVMNNATSIEKEEVNIVKNTGEKNIYWSVKRPLYDTNGNVIGMSGISTDITERKNLENEIKDKKELLDVILDNVDAYVYIKDIHRNFIYVNKNTAKLFGKPIDEIIGHQDRDVLPIEMADIFWESDKAVFSKNAKVTTEETIVDPKGLQKHYWSIKLPYTMNNEKVLIGFSSDITEIYLLKEKLKKESITDHLTGLYNKRHFDIIAETEYHRSNRQEIDMSMIILDIDYFKRVNDKYGHHIGDLILKESSKIFQSQIREEDTLCRIGGEEFTVILPHTNINKAKEIANRIRTSIENNIFKSDKEETLSITISLGVSSLIQSDEKFEDILIRADKALYNAKENGRNNVSSETGKRAL